MFTDDNDHWDLSFGIIVVGIIVIGLIVIAHKREPKGPSTQALPTMDVMSAPASAPELAPAEREQSRSPRIIATVYECFINGERVMSDRPCATNATLREISAPNRMDAQDTSHLYDPTPPYAPTYAPPGPESSSSGSARPVSGASCDAIQAAIDAIDARMRQKYTSRQGEHYREQLRDLREARWDANCRWRKN